MKVLVQQLGARMDYAVARGLEDAGRLAGLVTDLHFDAPVPTALSRYRSGLPAGRVSRDLAAGAGYRAMLRLAGASTGPDEWAARSMAARTARKARAWGAGIAYGFDTAFLPSMDRLGRMGLMRVLEQCIAPRAHFLSLVPRLAARLDAAGIAPEESGLRRQAERARRQSRVEAEEWARADLVVAPSRFVADALMGQGVPRARIRVVPYGVTVPDPGPSPERGARPRVAFAGGLAWRKGALEYLRLAGALSGMAEFHLLGGLRVPEGAARRLAPDLVLNGHLPRAELMRRLSGCDLVVLPSWWEGSATVIYEAMALGLACIVTPETGSVITHGEDGLMVPAGDDEALAAAAEGLLADPERRREMGRAAARTARRHTRESYGARVAETLADLSGRAPAEAAP